MVVAIFVMNCSFAKETMGAILKLARLDTSTLKRLIYDRVK